MKTYKSIMLEEKDGLAILTLNRPTVYNAFSWELIEEMKNALEYISKSERIKVLIITGAGKGFQAGADINEISKLKPMEILRWNEGLNRNNALIEKIRQPVIAAINGVALGGGFELALACTLRIIVESAKLGLPEVKLGILPGAGGTQRLPRLIGKGRAYEILLTGNPIDAEHAHKIGLVNMVVPNGNALQCAEELARTIMKNGPIAIELTKDAVEIGMDIPLEQAVQYAQKNCITCFSTQDMIEGTTAFLEKRTANFHGK